MGSSVMSPNYMGDYYLRPYTRCGVYCVGFMFGLFCHYLENKNMASKRPTMSIKPWQSTLLQAIGCILLCLLTLIQHYCFPNGLLVDEWSQNEDTLWDVFCRPLWGVGLSILSFS